MGPFNAAKFNNSNVNAGDYEVAVSNEGNVRAGEAGAALTNSGDATAGDEGLAAAQYNSTCRAGAGGFALCRESGSAISGDHGRSLVGPEARAKAGENGILFVGYYNEEEQKYRYKIACVGEDGIEPHTFYRADNNGNIQSG